MSIDQVPATPEEVMGRVLRRAELAKMTRKLQDRLALAKFKTTNGLDTWCFAQVEAQVDGTLKRRRVASSVVSSSDSSSDSSTCDRPVFSSSLISSSPLPRVFSNSTSPSDPPTSRKRTRFLSSSARRSSQSDGPRGQKPMAPPQRQSERHHTVRFSPKRHSLSELHSLDGPSFSFSEAITIPSSPTFASDDEDHQLPMHSFTQAHGSPPRTPPPTRSRTLRNRKVNGGEEGADLLLYLATSPSPANPSSKHRSFPPSTPPSNHMPTTLFADLSTPGQNFNFADFVNVTPSPAQAAFTRTPGMSRTPLAAREARKKLNFDNLIPPGGSPNMSRGRANAGLGMELGGELLS